MKEVKKGETCATILQKNGFPDQMRLDGFKESLRFMMK